MNTEVRLWYPVAVTLGAMTLVLVMGHQLASYVGCSYP